MIVVYDVWSRNVTFRQFPYYAKVTLRMFPTVGIAIPIPVVNKSQL